MFYRASWNGAWATYRAFQSTAGRPRYMPTRGVPEIAWAIRPGWFHGHCFAHRRKTDLHSVRERGHGVNPKSWKQTTVRTPPRFVGCITVSSLRRRWYDITLKLLTRGASLLERFKRSNVIMPMLKCVAAPLENIVGSTSHHEKRVVAVSYQYQDVCIHMPR